ncbi:aminotransferase class I/II-fold pyridoxal phosphate-dependent enzyme [Flavobacterium amniphilum]|uniref:pyridoxal phosphate-dependent aminotransferase n=1 Tax=Flavobacterium amniphilum TaxID=1834035 RepID=UPI00202A8E98|nr:aminotransferase class I/II-fold pyridoxal phosphate-dependent enzyme [Flavobacterium amniphilum]MCL9804500.1 aminotransferase class I/II-fold pyridoxal phosphate-dependent enzyme [Flavobacterium amniphilum]
MIFLDKNEFPSDFPKSIKEEVISELIISDWNRYPVAESQELIALIAQLNSVPTDSLILGNGSSGLIMRFLGELSKHYNRIVTPNPSFELFDICPKLFDLNHITWDFNNELDYDYAGFPRGKNSIYVFCTPNNPTGTLIDPIFVETEIANDPSSVFLIDEAYAEFANDSYAHLTQKYNNVIVLKTFSKALGAAAIRLGYAMCSDTIKNQLKKNDLPFKFSPFTIISAKVLLNNFEKVIQPRIERIIEAREKMFHTLNEMLLEGDVKVYKSHGNFIPIRFYNENLKNEFIQRCTDSEVIIGKVRNSPNFFRITIGSEKENTKIIRIIEGLVLKPICISDGV